MTVLSQEIVERLVSQFLEGLHAFGSEQPELLPGLLVKLDAFANHGVDPRSGEGRRFECPMRVVRVGIIIFGGFSVFFQLALASFCKLLPGLSHLLQVLAMGRGGSSRHVPTFRSVLKVFVQFPQVECPRGRLHGIYAVPRSRKCSGQIRSGNRGGAAEISKFAERTYCEQRTNSVHCLSSVDSDGAAGPRCRGVESRP